MAHERHPQGGGGRRRRLHPANAVRGAQVTNPAGEDLGSIEDVVLDPETGRIAYGVISFGGFMGLGEKLFAVPWSEFELTGDDGGTFVLDVSEESLKEAPGFDKDHWPDMGDPRWSEQVHSHYGRRPYWEEQAGERPPRGPDAPPPA